MSLLWILFYFIEINVSKSIKWSNGQSLPFGMCGGAAGWNRDYSLLYIFGASGNTQINLTTIWQFDGNKYRKIGDSPLTIPGDDRQLSTTIEDIIYIYYVGMISNAPILGYNTTS
eukprot:380100_1